MEFCLNYSEPAAELLRRGAISMDRFKCATFPEMIAAAKPFGPVYVHFPLEVGREKTTWDLDAVAAMRKDTQTPYVNVHLAAHEEEYAALGNDGPRAMIDRTMEQLEILKKRFGKENIILESLMYRDAKGFFYRPAVDPKVVAKIVRDADIGFLLDISHARLAARQTAMLEADYMRHLPTERMRELHITGLGEVDGLWQDHMPLTHEDWRWAQYALDEIASGAWPAPWCTALEYGGTGPAFIWRTDKEIIREQVPRLFAMVKKAAGG